MDIPASKILIPIPNIPPNVLPVITFRLIMGCHCIMVIFMDRCRRDKGFLGPIVQIF